MRWLTVDVERGQVCCALSDVGLVHAELMEQGDFYLNGARVPNENVVPVNIFPE